jgi:hypothetical protein
MTFYPNDPSWLAIKSYCTDKINDYTKTILAPSTTLEKVEVLRAKIHALQQLVDDNERDDGN